MKNLLLTLCLFVVPSTFAWSQFSFISEPVGMLAQEGPQALLTKIISEPENGAVHSLFIISDEQGAFQRLRRESPSGEQTISSQDLLSGEVVVAKSDGYDAVFLSATGCDIKTGGMVKIKYLYDGMSMSYRTVQLKLVHTNEGWSLRTKAGVKVNTLTLVANSFFGQTIGIEEIRVNAVAGDAQ